MRSELSLHRQTRQAAFAGGIRAASDYGFKTTVMQDMLGGLAPVLPDTQAIAVSAAMNSRGERIF
ncbi:hypothetical protein, partial [Paracoccus fontiphilus]